MSRRASGILESKPCRPFSDILKPLELKMPGDKRGRVRVRRRVWESRKVRVRRERLRVRVRRVMKRGRVEEVKG